MGYAASRWTDIFKDDNFLEKKINEYKEAIKNTEHAIKFLG